MDKRTVHGSVSVPITCVSPVTAIGANMTTFSSVQTSSELYFKQDLVLIFSKDPDTRFLLRTLLESCLKKYIRGEIAAPGPGCVT